MKNFYYFESSHPHNYYFDCRLSTNTGFHHVLLHLEYPEFRELWEELTETYRASSYPVSSEFFMTLFAKANEVLDDRIKVTPFTGCMTLVIQSQCKNNVKYRCFHHLTKSDIVDMTSYDELVENTLFNTNRADIPS